MTTPPTASSNVAARGNLQELRAKAEQDAQSAGVPGITREIKPVREGGAEAVVNDPVIPKGAKDAPWFGVPPAEGVPFKTQVEGNARYYRGKFTRDDQAVEQGAGILRGEVEPKSPSKKQ